MPMMPTAGQGGPPPGLAALLMGASPGGAAPMGAGPPPGLEEDQGPEQESMESHLEQMLMHARMAMDAQDADNQERATISKAITILRSLMGDREKQSDAALGVSPQVRAMRRSYAG